MITKNSRQKLALDRPSLYQIKVPGHLDRGWLDDDGELVIAIGNDEAGSPLTTLTGNLDQAALIGLLRRLYSLGLPLISVNCLEVQ